MYYTLFNIGKLLLGSVLVQNHLVYLVESLKLLTAAP
jgi:hypothetical protein